MTDGYIFVSIQLPGGDEVNLLWLATSNAVGVLLTAIAAKVRGDTAVSKLAVWPLA
jgi:hypothetical protein